MRSMHTLCLFLVVMAALAGRVAAVESCGDRQSHHLEERLARVEERLNRLLVLLSRESNGDALESVKAEIAGLAAEVGAQQAKAEQVTNVETAQSGPAATQESAQPPVRAALVQAAPEAAEEIINLPYSGYMELHLNKDGINPATLDFHRFVLLFGHGFGDRIRFWSELELEHAFVEGGEPSGELELEQAYLDFLIDPRLNFRAGMLLAPVGIINERHEPPSFNGVERPFVDTFIVPSTWFGSGAGFVGDLGHGFAYRTYLMSSLNALEFSAEEGFAEGRQKGFFENVRNPAWTGRIEYRGVPGLNLGMSYWTGRTGFELPDINGRASIFELDGRLRWRRFQGRGQFATTHLDDAGAINRAIRQRRGINPNIAESMRGFYVEGGASVLPARLRHDAVVFYRYEDFDTQFRMPEGFLPLKQFDRSAHILGLTYYPYPDIALKMDYNFMRNASPVVRVPNRWNFGIGWWF